MLWTWLKLFVVLVKTFLHTLFMWRDWGLSLHHQCNCSQQLWQYNSYNISLHYQCNCLQHLWQYNSYNPEELLSWRSLVCCKWISCSKILTVKDILFLQNLLHTFLGFIISFIFSWWLEIYLTCCWWIRFLFGICC